MSEVTPDIDVLHGMLEQQAEEIGRLKKQVGDLQAALHLANMEQHKEIARLKAIIRDIEALSGADVPIPAGTLLTIHHICVDALKGERDE